MLSWKRTANTWKADEFTITSYMMWDFLKTRGYRLEMRGSFVGNYRTLVGAKAGAVAVRNTAASRIKQLQARYLHAMERSYRMGAIDTHRDTMDAQACAHELIALGAEVPRFIFR